MKEYMYKNTKIPVTELHFVRNRKLTDNHYEILLLAEYTSKPCLRSIDRVSEYPISRNQDIVQLLLDEDRT